MTDTQLKKVYWLLIGGGIFLILFIAIFNGCLFGIEPQRLETQEGLYGLLFAIFIPMLLSVDCFIIAMWKCKSFTKHDAIRQNEKQLKNGIINQEQFFKNVREIETNDIEKKRFNSMVEKERVAFAQSMKNEVIKEMEIVKEVEENV